MIKTLLPALFMTALVAAPSAVAEDGRTAEARKALIDFTEAVRAGPDALTDLLAPEYQIMRANGVGYDYEGYLGAVTAVAIGPEFAHEELVVTTSEDVMVVRYFLRIEETIDGAPVARRAPRLTVFRRIDDVWKPVAHANFGATEPAN